MARKSRKDAIANLRSDQPLPVPEAAPAQPIWNTAAYARLSMLEGTGRQGTEALQNQKALLLDFLKSRADLHLQNMYADNGETGTNFQRPAFQQMMEAVRAGKVNCIVVKDLSRFGRDYVEAGDYLEHIFPFMGVRFISITDGYDSADATTGDALKIALKNLVNTIYSRDISRKVGSVLREKQRRGEFIGAFAPYGYLRDPQDKHRLVVNAETAPVVQEIFRRKLAGESIYSIARWLNEVDIPSPFTYLYQREISSDKRFAVPRLWESAVVKSILQNAAYLGHMVQGKDRSEFYAGKPHRRTDPSEWVIVENTHEAIIAQEDFDQVRELIRQSTERHNQQQGKYDYLGYHSNILKGMVFCADCGRRMMHHRQVVRGERVDYRYLCTNNAARLKQNSCVNAHISEEQLHETLRNMILSEAAQAVDFAALLAGRKKIQFPAAVKLAAELSSTATAQTGLQGLRECLMRDFVNGTLTEQDYARLKETYTKEGETLQRRMDDLRVKQEHDSQTLTEQNLWLATFRDFSGQF